MLLKVRESILAQLGDNNAASTLNIPPRSDQYHGRKTDAQELCMRALGACAEAKAWYVGASQVAEAWNNMGLLGFDKEQAWAELQPEQFRERLAVAHPQRHADKHVTVAIVCAVILWKSKMITHRGTAFVLGILIRKLNEMLDEKFETSENELQDVMFVLLGIHNTSNEYPIRGSKDRDSEAVIKNVLSRECAFFAEAFERASLIAEEDVNSYRNTGWRYPAIRKRKPSECLAVFLRRGGDLFTAREGGLFTLSMDEEKKLYQWRAEQSREWEIITREIVGINRKYVRDKDGWCYRSLSWRWLVVHLGTLGSFLFSLVATLLDLGAEGKNVLKRINFFGTLFVSLDLIILGIMKIVDRNEKAVTDGIFFKTRVFDIGKEFSGAGYSSFRKAMAFHASPLADIFEPTNMCYASSELRGTVLSSQKMTKEEVKDMFFVIEHAYHSTEKMLLNKNTGNQFVLELESDNNSFISPATGLGIHFTSIVRLVRNDDNIGHLG